jgi:DNA-directed RNA polymerase specialized sigma24 family protein
MPAAKRAPLDPRVARLADPDVLARIRERVPRDMQEADANDVMQLVYEKLLLLDPLPETKEGLLALVGTMTKHGATDRFRQIQRERGKLVDVDGDEHGDGGGADHVAAPDAEPLDVQVEKLRRLADEEHAKGRISAEQRDVAHLLFEGLSYAQISEATGRPIGTVKSDAFRLKAHFAKHWPKWATGIAMVVLLAIGLSRRREVFTIGPDTNGMDRPAASTAPPAPTTIDDHDATWFRGDANLMCSDRLWDQCEQDLDNAKKLDPKSEDLPDVKQWRQDIRDGRAQDQRNLQPQNGGRPPKPPLK